MADIVNPGLPAAGPINAAYMPSNTDLVIYRGDYVEFFVNFLDGQNNPLDLTGYTVKAQLRTSYDDPAPITINTTVDLANNRVRVYISSAVSATLTNTSYIWDLQATNAQGDNRTFLTGDVTVHNEVTV